MLCRVCFLLLITLSFQRVLGECDALLLAEQLRGTIYISIVELRAGLHRDVNNALELGDIAGMWEALSKPFAKCALLTSIASRDALINKHTPASRTAGTGRFTSPAEVLEWAVNPHGDENPGELELMPLHVLTPQLLNASGALVISTETAGCYVRVSGGRPLLSKNQWRTMSTLLYNYSLKSRKLESSAVGEDLSVEEMVQAALSVQEIKSHVKRLPGLNSLWIRMDEGNMDKLLDSLRFIVVSNSKM